MTRICQAPGCDQPVRHALASYCSTDCENLGIEYAAEVVRAAVNDDDPPSEQAFLKRKKRAERWSAERMQQRINELKAQP